MLIRYYVTQRLKDLIINFSVSSFSSIRCQFFIFNILCYIDTQFCIGFNYAWHFRMFVIGVIYIFYIFNLDWLLFRTCSYKYPVSDAVSPK
jgi:hypothetical protein